MEGYRRNIDILIGNRDKDLAEKETLLFNEYIDKFSHFYKDDMLEDDLPMEEELEMMDSMEIEGGTMPKDTVPSGIEE